MKDFNQEHIIKEKTGLLLTPPGPGDMADGARDRAMAGELCFGTVDSFLIRLTKGATHATDATNAAAPASTTSMRRLG